MTTGPDGDTPAWTLQARQPLRAPGVRAVSISPDGTAVLVRADGGLTMLDREGEPLWRWSGPGPGSSHGNEVAWALGGDQVYLVTDGRIMLLDGVVGEQLPVGDELAQLREVTGVSLSHDGRRLAVATADRHGSGNVLVADLVRDRVQPLRGLVDPSVALTWSSPTTLLTATEDVVQLWNADTAVLTRPVVVGARGIRAMAVAAHQGSLAVVEGGGLRLVDTRDPDQAVQVTLPDVHDVLFSRFGLHLLVGTRQGLHVLTAQGIPTSQVPADVAAAGQLAVADTGTVVVRLGADHVAVYEPPDVRPTLTSSRRGAGSRRWALLMGRTVGRSTIDPQHPARPTVRTRTLLTTDGGTAPCLAWGKDSRSHYVQMPPGQIRRYAGDPPQLDWTTTLPDGDVGYELTASADDGILAVATHLDQGRVYLVDCRTGAVLRRVPGGQSPTLDPTGALLAVPEPGRNPRNVLVYRVGDASLQTTREVRDGIGRIAWSPDGARLAAAARGRVMVWDTSTWRRVEGPADFEEDAVLSRVAWSPDGRMLAVTVAGHAPASLFETSAWTLQQRFADPGGLAWAPAVTWAPDSRMVLWPAARQARGTTEIWDVHQGLLLISLSGQDGDADVWSAAWSPDGQTIAIGHGDGSMVMIDLDNAPVPPASTPVRLPYPVDVLARLGAVCADVGCRVPLSLLTGLLATLDGAPPPELAVVASSRPVLALRELRWPVGALIGVVAMIAVELSGEGRFGPPAATTREERAAALRQVLSAVPTAAVAPPPPMAELGNVLAGVDDRTITLLTILGPLAVEADPTLPTQLRGLRREITPLTQRQRRLLGLRLSFAEDGPAEGRGQGDSRAGLSRHGTLNNLLFTQLALPPEVFELRMARDELLYRTRHGRLPPGLRNVVLLLDDTPPAFGQVGLALRTFAHLAATATIEHNRPCTLVRLGSAEVTVLARHQDLVLLWNRHCLTPADPELACSAVAARLPHLTDEVSGPPRIVALTHPHLLLPPLPGLVTVRVHYPGRPVPAAHGDIVLAPDPDMESMRNALISALLT